MSTLKRINPKFSVDQMGNIKWISSIMDYDPDLYYRGKKVTADEYNALFIKQATQSNYTADSLQELLNTHLGTAIRRRVAQDFNLVSSFIKIYTSADWGDADEKGYHYISIPVSEHGFQPTDTEDILDRINIEADMYVLNNAGAFTLTQQVEIHPDNTVRVYTDDPSIQGFIAIRANDKAYALSEVIMDATQIVGLAPVAISGSFDDLAESEEIRQQIQQNTDNVLDLASGKIKVGFAEQANYANALTPNSTIQNIRVSDIFETGSRYVKNATTAKNYESTGGIAAKFTDIESQINNKYTSLTQGFTTADAKMFTQITQDFKIADAKMVTHILSYFNDFNVHIFTLERGSGMYFQYGGLVFMLGHVSTPSGKQEHTVFLPKDVFEHSSVNTSLKPCVFLTPVSDTNIGTYALRESSAFSFTYWVQTDRMDMNFLIIGPRSINF